MIGPQRKTIADIKPPNVKFKGALPDYSQRLMKHSAVTSVSVVTVRTKEA